MLFAQLLGGLGNVLFITANLYSLSIDREMDYCVTNYTQSCTKRKSEGRWISTMLKSVNKVNKRPNNVKLKYRERGMNVQKIPQTKGKGLELYGYWQSSKYFDHNRGKIIELFTEFKKEIQKDLDKIFNYKGKTIALHIRRGDYVQLQHAHVVQDIKYYEQALERMAKELEYETVEALNKDYRVMVFSDDIDWCKTVDLFKSLKNVKYMARNPPIEDMYLMSMCDHHIIANSTFSWWGAYLNTNEDQKVMAPSKWFNPNYKKPSEWKDIYCEKWIVI